MTAILMLGFETEKLQGQPEGVVEISLGLEDVEFCAESGSDGFLGGGLSGRAGNANHALAPLATHVRRE